MFLLILAQGMLQLAETILAYLDAQSLCAAELVCHEWLRVIAECLLWKKLIKKQVETDPIWKGILVHRACDKFLYKSGHQQLFHVSDIYEQHRFFKKLYMSIIRDKDRLNQNWQQGKFVLEKIHCRSENSKGVYCLQYDNKKIVCGLRDNTIKVWDRNNREFLQMLSGHTGSVLCLQYDRNVIVSGSSDTTVR